jgi:hypothetical protein
MNDWHNDPDRAGLENVIRALKKPLHLDEAFELRVMSAVHADALSKIDAGQPAEHWWSRRYTVRFTALGGLAAAASIAAVIALTSISFNRSSMPIAAGPDAAIRTQFVLVNEDARQVFLVGDFNNWSKIPLERTANQSAWSVSIPLSEGKHEYAFIVDDGSGEHWVADPLTRPVEDEFGTESSIVRVEPTSS